MLSLFWPRVFLKFNPESAPIEIQTGKLRHASGQFSRDCQGYVSENKNVRFDIDLAC